MSAVIDSFFLSPLHKYALISSIWNKKIYLPSDVDHLKKKHQKNLIQNMKCKI